MRPLILGTSALLLVLAGCNSANYEDLMKEQIKLLIVSSGRHSVAVRDLSAWVHQQNPHVPTILIGDANETGSSVNPQTANWVWLLQPFSSEELAGAIQRLSSAVNRGVAGALCA